jgi:Asp-tRNA(Asn)/Glu-tRNA(Gln) amidotransferase A subunit family amidase
MTTRLIELGAVELSRAYADRTLSPVEVVEAGLARIDAWEPKLNAMYLLDREGALAQARGSEARWRRGEAFGPLDGVPITVKDNVALAGTPAPLGCAAFADSPPATADSPPAARVREAGCVILGKTTMPDFGMLASGVSSLHGTTRNPWDLARNTAGSSSGAAAGLAALYGPLALGTDIGGSVRLPAAYCGVVALKPSLGRVPIHPPYAGRVTGPMTRTVADAALLMTALTRPDPRDYMNLPYERWTTRRCWRTAGCVACAWACCSTSGSARRPRPRSARPSRRRPACSRPRAPRSSRWRRSSTRPCSTG